MKNYQKILILLGGVFIATPVLGAPTANVLRNVFPEETTKYDIGTSTPNLWWNHFYSKYASTTLLTTGTIDATSTTATSTFGNGIQLSNGCFRMPNGSCLISSTGTINSGTINRLSYYSGATTLDSANFLTADVSNLFLGIGTSTPGSPLSIQGAANFQPSGTSTIYTGLQLPGLLATSTGITITGGGLINSVSGTSTKIQDLEVQGISGRDLRLTGGVEGDGGNIVMGGAIKDTTGIKFFDIGAATIYDGTPEEITSLDFSNRRLVNAAGTPILYWGTNVGIGSSTPLSALSIGAQGASSGGLYLNGDIGIGTSSPGAALAIATSTAGTRTALLLSNLGSGYTMWAEDSANDTSPFVIDASGNVGIGTSTPGAKLAVEGDVLFATSTLIITPDTPTIAGTVTNPTFMDAPGDVAVQGHYAYVPSVTSDSFAIVDVTIPTDPRILGTIKDSNKLNGANAVVVNGSYAYVSNAVADKLTVIDVSNPDKPVIVNSITSATQLDNIASMYLSGKYIYAASRDDDLITVIDISIPTVPRIISSTAADAANLNDPWEIVVQGKFAYVTHRLDSAGNQSGAGLTIYDISNPNAIVKASTTASTSSISDARGLDVAGRYAYVTGIISDSLTIFDIASSTAPVEVGTVKESVRMNGVTSVKVVGKYAYVMSSSDILAVVDVSDPTNPRFVTSITSSTELDGAEQLVVSGNHLYVVANTDDMLTVVNIGSEIPTLYAGGLTTGSLFVEDDAVFGNSAYIAGGANISGHLSAMNGFSSFYSNKSTTTLTTAGNEFGSEIYFQDISTTTTGTDNSYGLYASTTRLGATGGTINTYGGYFTVTGDTAGSGTSNNYGLYVSASGADVNYGLYSDNGMNYFAGSVGIGTTSPATTTAIHGALLVAGMTSTAQFTATGTVYMTGLDTEAGASDDALCRNNTTFRIEVNAGATTCLLSTRESKENINPLDIGLKEFLGLKPSSFISKADNKPHIGLIAEDMFEIEPRLVVLDEQGKPKTIRYEEFTALITKAIQDFYKEFQQLLARVSGVEKRLNKQEVKIKELEQRILRLEK